MTAALLALALAAGSGAPADTLPGAYELEHFRIQYTPRAAGAAAGLSRVVEAERAALAQRIGRDYEGRTEIFVVAGPEELGALGPPGLRPPVWASGAALPHANVLFFDARALAGDDGRRLLRHELAHLALGRMGGQWPRWFSEGFAMLVAGEWSLARYTAFYRAIFSEAGIPFAQLADHWPDRLDDIEVAYAQSFAFVSHLYDRYGEDRLRDLLGRVSAGEEFGPAFAAVYGVSLETEEQAWRAGLKSRYRWLPLLASDWTIWSLATVIFIAGYLRVRRRRRQRMEAMELEEQAREAAERIAAAEQAQREAAQLPEPPPPGRLN